MRTSKILSLYLPLISQQNEVTPTTTAVVSSVTVPANGTYTLGQNLDFTVNFSEAVTISGTPRLVLTIGSATAYANYVSGSGTTAILFRHTVVAGDYDTDGIALNSLELNSGSIVTTSSSSNATLTLNSVGSLTSVLVDGGVIYSLLDLFTTAESAPIASPRTCEPGPGGFVKNDSANKWSISGGALVGGSSGIPSMTPSADLATPTLGSVHYYKAKQNAANQRFSLYLYGAFILYLSSGQLRRSSTGHYLTPTGTIDTNYHNYYGVVRNPNTFYFDVDSDWDKGVWIVKDDVILDWSKQKPLAPAANNMFAQATSTTGTSYDTVAVAQGQGVLLDANWGRHSTISSASFVDNALFTSPQWMLFHFRIDGPGNTNDTCWFSLKPSATFDPHDGFASVSQAVSVQIVNDGTNVAVSVTGEDTGVGTVSTGIVIPVGGTFPRIVTVMIAPTYFHLRAEAQGASTIQSSVIACNYRYTSDRTGFYYNFNDGFDEYTPLPITRAAVDYYNVPASALAQLQRVGS